MTITRPHKNKTTATLLASLFGALGIHRFYLHGKRDRWGWLHAGSLPLSVLAALSASDTPWLFTALPLLLSMLAGFIEALVIGLTADEQWDARHNRDSGRQSHSRWPLALLLVLTTGLGATALIAIIARLSDLALTGGAYG
jgi:TM2 domain-containing membrane protein YozV